MIKSLKCSLNSEYGNMQYIYNVTEGNFLVEGEKIKAYGIKAESILLCENKTIPIYSDEIRCITPCIDRVERFAEFLCKNKVSPFHILDVFQDYEEDVLVDFDKDLVVK